ncbi:MAG: hypothetical protein DRG20_00010 [Deltaproteobacteria bacterium]|nr:MAG: hypothetical protein DRG20_00010 [Deltaproteobacteria bacterium]
MIKKRNIIFFTFFLITTFILMSLLVPFSFGKEKAEIGPDGSPVVLKVGKMVVTTKELDRIIKSMGPRQQERLASKDAKAKFLQTLARFLAVYQEAKKLGYDKDELVKEKIKISTYNILYNYWVEKNVKQVKNVSDEEVKKYYEEHKNIFSRPPMINAAHILIEVKNKTDQKEWDKALKKAKMVLKKLKEGERFEDLAKKYSDDKKSREAGGMIGYYRKGTMPPEFEEAVSRLKPGEISDIVKTNFGYHIIKLIDIKEKSYENFNRVKRPIKRKLIMDKNTRNREKKIDEVMKKYHVTIYEDKL